MRKAVRVIIHWYALPIVVMHVINLCKYKYALDTFSKIYNDLQRFAKICKTYRIFKILQTFTKFHKHIQRFTKTIQTIYNILQNLIKFYNCT